MYPQPGQTGQWNPNATPPSAAAQPQQGQPQQQQQWAPAPPPQHSPNGHPQQPNGQYPQQRAQVPGQIAPMPQGTPPQGQPMNPMQPQHHDPYRSLPPPGHIYAHPPFHPQQPIQYPPQPAPRQRTAIACRYCRRRKIRCSGFEHSEDARCTNCQRFNQECIFTPVSHQTQAFVPAHAVMGRGNGQMPPQLYGAYGQPLQYYPPPYGVPPNGYPGYPPQHLQPGQLPQGPLPPPGQQLPGSAHGVPSPSQQPQQAPPQAEGQKPANEDSQTPTQAPPAGNPAQPPQGQQRSASTSSAVSLQSGQPGQPNFYPTPASQPGQHSQSNADPAAQTFGDGQHKADGNGETSPDPTNSNTVNGSYPAPTSDANAPEPAAAGNDSDSPNGVSKSSLRVNELVGEKGEALPSSPEQTKTSPASAKSQKRS